MADSGFSQGGGANSSRVGGTNIRFCQIFPKTAPLMPSLNPPMLLAPFDLVVKMSSISNDTSRYLAFLHITLHILGIRIGTLGTRRKSGAYYKEKPIIRLVEEDFVSCLLPFKCLLIRDLAMFYQDLPSA